MRNWLILWRKLSSQTRRCDDCLHARATPACGHSDGKPRMIFRARWATGVHVAVCTAAREQLREARREHVFNFDARDFPFAEVRMFRALKDTYTCDALP